MVKNKMSHIIQISIILLYAGSLLVSKSILNTSIILSALFLAYQLFINKTIRIELLKSKENIFLMGIFVLMLLFNFISPGGIKSSSIILHRFYRIIPMFTLPFLVDDLKKIKIFISIISASLMINFYKGYSLYSINKGQPWYRYQSYMGIMSTAHIVLVISFLLLGILIYSLKTKNKIYSIIFLISYPMSLYIILLGKTRGVWLAFIVNTLFFILCILDIKKIFISIITTILLLTIVINNDSLMNNQYVARFKTIANYKKDDSPKIRMILWEGAYNIAKDNPIFGVGKHNSSSYYKEYAIKTNAYAKISDYAHSALDIIMEYGNTHNMYFNSLMENGFIIFIIQLLFSAYIFFESMNIYIKRKNKNDRYILLGIILGTTAFYLSGLTENSMNEYWMMICFSTVIGLNLSYIKMFKNKTLINVNNLEKIETSMEDLYLIKTKRFKDERGNLFEAYNKLNFEGIGINDNFVQDNFTVSSKGVLRGLHFQKINSQSKLIRVVKGKILDVVVDLRKDSETFSKISTFELSMENDIALYIPKGMAHGFLSLEDNTIVCYKCGDYFNPSIESGIIWNDKDLNIDWKLEKYSLSEDELILSKKDKKQKTFKEIIKEIKF